jgi:hypothetical protein
MTTLRITVDNKKNARLLSKILKNMNFVKKIEEENSASDNQYEILNKLFNTLEPGRLFNQIDDPLKWQKEIRDEWETR